MPLLRHDDPLPFRPSRVVVNGTSGAGKSTLAARIGGLLGLPYTEMDGLFHGPGWTPNPEFLDVVDEFTSKPGWVCEYQYDVARPLLARRADLMVWLDLSTPVVMWQVTRRTVQRRLRSQELWNGNREAPLHTFWSDPEHVVRYAWSTRHDAASRAQALLDSSPELMIVRLRSRREVERWLTGPLTREADGDGQRVRR